VFLHFLTPQVPSATQAVDQIEPSVEVDHALIASGLVKPGHVLRQHDFGLAHRFEARQSSMGVLCSAPAELSPSNDALCNSSGACLLAHERLLFDELLALLVSIRITVIRNAEIRASA
jgi:hypothetical protein